jgi:hypothetical protein
MIRVLVVHHDIDLADQEVESLRRRGYQVNLCGGPSRNNCPLYAGGPCELAAEAQVLIYDAFADGSPGGSENLIEQLRLRYPETPLVLTNSGLGPVWARERGPGRVTLLSGSPSGANLEEAIQAALAKG